MGRHNDKRVPRWAMRRFEGWGELGEDLVGARRTVWGREEEGGRRTEGSAERGEDGAGG